MSHLRPSQFEDFVTVGRSSRPVTALYRKHSAVQEFHGVLDGQREREAREMMWRRIAK